MNWKKKERGCPLSCRVLPFVVGTRVTLSFHKCLRSKKLYGLSTCSVWEVCKLFVKKNKRASFFFAKYNTCAGVDGAHMYVPLYLACIVLKALKNYCYTSFHFFIFTTCTPRATFYLQISHDVLWVLVEVCFLSPSSCSCPCRIPSQLFEWIDYFFLNFVWLATAIGWMTWRHSPCRCRTSLWIDCWNCFGYARNPPRPRPLDRNRMFSPVCQCSTCIFFCLCPIFDRG